MYVTIYETVYDYECLSNKHYKTNAREDCCCVILVDREHSGTQGLTCQVELGFVSMMMICTTAAAPTQVQMTPIFDEHIIMLLLMCPELKLCHVK